MSIQEISFVLELLTNLLPMSFFIFIRRKLNQNNLMFIHRESFFLYGLCTTDYLNSIYSKVLWPHRNQMGCIMGKGNIPSPSATLTCDHRPGILIAAKTTEVNIATDTLKQIFTILFYQDWLTDATVAMKQKNPWNSKPVSVLVYVGCIFSSSTSSSWGLIML